MICLFTICLFKYLLNLALGRHYAITCLHIALEFNTVANLKAFKNRQIYKSQNNFVIMSVHLSVRFACNIFLMDSWCSYLAHYDCLWSVDYNGGFRSLM